MNYLTYPCKLMWITATYDSSKPHKLASTGIPKSYPIDDQSDKNTGKAWFYCPCDEMIVKKMYGIGGPAGNTIWLESSSKVKTPTFNDYITIMIVHPEDADMKKIKVGDKFKRGEKIFPAGQDGNASGRHHHIEIGRGKCTGWIKNSNNTWIIKNSIKPEDAFYIDKSFNTVYKDKGIKFKELPKAEKIIYIVVKGDTLTKIAKKYKTTWKKIYDDNKALIDTLAKQQGIKSKYYNYIYAGTKLIIKEG